MALCPHCRKPVKAVVGKIAGDALRDAYARVLADKLAFWQAEASAWAAEFGTEATQKLLELIR